MPGKEDGSLTHFDTDGRPRMVDVSAKDETTRTAVASGAVKMNAGTLEIVRSRTGKKGDAISVAELAGIMGAKRTADLIPLCHPLPLSAVKIETTIDDANSRVVITALAKTTGKTGVEMEALTAVTTACLTLYDMLKAVDRAMVIENIKLVEKTGGASGDFHRDHETTS